MDIFTHKFAVTKTSRVFTCGNRTHPKYIWILLHGYGHAADQFLSFFSSLNHGNNLLIAPEGLHRFYAKGFNGRVGASWMTKEERDDDIQDYVAWLKLVYEQFIPADSKAKIIVLGFSQGGATAARFLEKSGLYADFLVLYAATFPPDVVPSGNLVRYVRNKLFFILGDEDEFIDKALGEKQLQMLRLFGKELVKIEFKGKHVIDSDVLGQLEQEIWLSRSVG